MYLILVKFIAGMSLFLQTFSRNKDWKKYCLAHLFTYQDFADGVIGLAYVGNRKRNAVGGICTEGDSVPISCPLDVQLSVLYSPYLANCFSL